MKCLWICAVLLTLGCDKGASKSVEPAPSASAALPASRASANAEAVARATPSDSLAGHYEGTAVVSVGKSTTTKKEGAPSNWEQDEGKRFTGECRISITIAPNGTVDGTLKGALGDHELRGAIAGDDVRAVLVPTNGEVTSIQNGYLSLARSNAGLKGKLTAASGDSLHLRVAELDLKKNPS
ncbi:MAG: hypothetical protein QM784_34210 [Polyangiaceae bacterium]